MNYIFLFIISMLISIGSLPFIIKYATKNNIFDEIDNRKIHKKKIVRLGGISIFLSFIVSNFFFNEGFLSFSPIIICSSIIFLLGLFDDIKNLSPRTKFIGQVLIAMLFIILSKNTVTNIYNILPGISLKLTPLLSFIFTTLFLTTVMNAINLSDGLDGLASGISLIAAIFLLYFSLRFLDKGSVCIVITIIGSIIGFLKYNSYPAKVFMGDSGSMFLGFLLGSFFIKFLSKIETFPFYTILMILGIPFLDMLHVIYLRIRSKKSITKADRNHFHYRLIDIGLTHTDSVKLIFFLMTLSGIIGSMPFIFPNQYSWFLWPVSIIFFTSIIILSYKTPKSFFVKLKKNARIKMFKTRLYRKGSFKSTSIITRYLKYLLIFTFLFPSFFTTGIPTFLGLTSFFTALILLLAFFLEQRKFKDYFLFIFYASTAILLIANNYNYLIIHIFSHNYNITLFYNIFFIGIVILSMCKFFLDVNAKYFKISILDPIFLLIPLFLTVFSKTIINEYHLLSVSLKFTIIFFSTKILFLNKAKKNRKVLVGLITGLIIVGVIGGFKIQFK